MKDVLIVKVKAHVHRNVLDDLYNTILAQKEKDVIMLPIWCDYELVNMQDNIEIKIEEVEKED